MGTFIERLRDKKKSIKTSSQDTYILCTECIGATVSTNQSLEQFFELEDHLCTVDVGESQCHSKPRIGSCKALCTPLTIPN